MKPQYKIARRLAKLWTGRRGPGYIDHFDVYRVAGWAFDPADSSTPALLSLMIDGTPAMNIVADLARDDVQAAGMGPRLCGFDAMLPKRLRDGKAHVVELRIGLNGPLVRGGRLRIDADPARAEEGDAALGDTLDNPSGAPEGVAYYNPRTAAIEGWATGCASVSVQFPDQATLDVVLNRNVPGFGTGSRQGFAVRIPMELMDGAEHEVEVCFEAGGTPLDGAPVRFATGIESPRVTITRRNGPRLHFEIRDINGHLMPHDIHAHADAEPLVVRAFEDRPGLYETTLPAHFTHLSLSDGEGTVLARYVAKGMALEEPPIALPSDSAASAETCAEARAAFDAFCAAPDDRFDPLWYRWVQPGAHGLAPEDLIGHYREAAAGGASPGPGFDEIAARRMLPGLVPLIEEGALPCAFALELVQGRGALNSLAHLGPKQARAMARGDDGREALMADLPDPESQPRPVRPPEPTPLPVTMPPPTSLIPASDNIYAAWVSRLALNARQRRTIEADERALRRDITRTSLTRAPLVSIIMPSWNRAFTIGEAIQSALDQTYRNWELIVCDDASEDRTVDVVRRFEDKRIRYMKFLKSNGAGARNKGLRHARGEYIAYLDSDNIWHPQFLDMMMRQLLGHPGYAIAYSAYLDTEIDGAKVLLHGVSRNSFRPVRLSSKNFMDLNTIVHHRRLYDWLGGFDTSLPRLQDWDLMLRYTGVFRPLFVNRIGVFYRRNAAWGQVTHLHMGSGAQNTVNEKTQARLEHGHERLNVDWPSRERITILCSQHRDPAETERFRVLAESLARMAADVVDVDLVVFGETGDEIGEAAASTEEAVPMLSETASEDGAVTMDPAPEAEAPTPEAETEQWGEAPEDLELDEDGDEETEEAAEAGPEVDTDADAGDMTGSGGDTLTVTGGMTGAGAMPRGVTRHGVPRALARDPLQLGLVMAPQLQGRPVLSVGLLNDYLRAVHGLDTGQTYRLRPSGDGSMLQGLDEPTIRFDLGALPIPLPAGDHDPEDLTVLVLPPVNPKRGYRRELEAEGRRRGLRLVLPPRRGLGWQLVQNGTSSTIETDGPLPDILGECAMTVALVPVSELSMFDMGLLNAMQGRGVPAAVLPDSGRARASGIATQWIEARAAYEIQTNSPKWIFDKVRKLLGDAGGMEQLSDRSRKVHRIAHAPDLAQERMVHGLYRMLFDLPKREVLDADA